MVCLNRSVGQPVRNMNKRLLTIPVTIVVLAGLVGGVIMPLPWLARENLFEFTARETNRSGLAKPCAPPNGSPATPPGNSEVAEEPPSVS